ncbi:hypothetical protein [Paraburkholderia rhizosphaerae]|uniref:Uncharacterized protein n=1 Tax=Paraburkholderia rhizosphaerae TaxID=480658 RepID=A0A4R8LS65_9BURK|nr:hypothetical protein [Paraburkholderia rhizosphaerae]TDY49932.1 hypothetical protein BX592_110186 [Paraburkholderia rhizosphaerae]
MRVGLPSQQQWPDQDEANGTRGQQEGVKRTGSRVSPSFRKKDSGSGTARRAAPASNVATAPAPATAPAAATAGIPADNSTHDENNRLATQLVVSNELLSASRSFANSTDAIDRDLAQNNDTTDHAIKAAGALSDMHALLSMEKPPPDMQQKIDRVALALDGSTKDDSPRTIGERAKVDLSALGQQSDLSRYGTYGKNASAYARNVIFGLSRFSNSELLASKGWFKDWRAGAKSFQAWIGDERRLGALLATRADAAGSTFVKGSLSFINGLNKLSKGEDPAKDFATAGATIAQGVNETVVGAGTDLGNYLAKTRAAAASSGESGPAEGAGQTGSTGSTTELKDFDSPDPLDAQIDEQSTGGHGHVDEQVAAQQSSLQDDVIRRVEGKHPDVKQLELQDAVADIAPEHIELEELGKSVKRSIADAARDAHENIKSIDEKAGDVVSGLKAQGFDSVEAARRSDSEAARQLCRQLDDYARLKREAYDHFNLAVAEREEALGIAKPAFAELGEVLKTTPASERGGKVQAWADKYGKFFAEKQDAFLAKTNTWPDWMKISKPLRMQLIPTGINTALGAVPFGFALDDYLRKQQAGKVTTKDQLALGAATLNLAAGPLGFVPVAGPFLSFALATAGAICGGLSDQYDQWKYQEYVGRLQAKCRDAYNAKHPDQEVAEPFDGG